MKKIFKKAIITIMMASFISVQISGTQVFARGNGHNHDHGHEHVHEKNEYEDLENTTTDDTMEETENEEDITSNNDEVVEENGPEDELLEEESTEGEVPTEDNEESTGEDNETPEFELPEVEIDESEEEPDVEGSEEIEEEIIDDENDTDTSEDEEVENENVSDSDIITLHPSVEEQLANLSQEQIDSYIEFAAKREPYYLQNPYANDYSWTYDSEGNLWKTYNPDKNFETMVETLYSTGVAYSFSWMYSVFYVLNNHEIHKVNSDGTNDIVIYTSDKSITQVIGNEEYLFFIADENIYRLHIMSGVCEFVCVTNEGFGLLPYDNHTICYAEYNGTMLYDDWDEVYREVQDYYYYDMSIGDYIECPEDCDRALDWEDASEPEILVEEPYISPKALMSISNAGIATLSAEDEFVLEWPLPPLDGYGVKPGAQYYFTKDGGACKKHASGTSGTNCFTFYGNKQCSGYATYAYYLYHGEVFDTSDTEDPTTDKIYLKRELTSDDWKKIPSGSWIRVTTKNSISNYNHVIFIYQNDGSGFVVYDANYKHICDINQWHYTYEEMAIQYKSVNFYYHPDNSLNEHVCTYSTGSNGSQHWKECTTCLRRKDIVSHTESGWYYDANFHYTKCKDCGYVMQKMEHTQGTTYEINGTTHSLSCTVCGMKMSEAAHNSSTTKNNNDGTHTLKCSVCGKSMSTASHTYGNYISDGSNHWKECTACKVITGKAAHTPGSLTNIGSIHRKTCTTCGYVTLSANHSYTSSYSKYSSSQHKATCACGAHQYVTHTMTLSGVSASGHTQICSKCGYSVTGSHTFTISKNDTNTHKKVCSFCGYSTTVNHTYVANGYNQYVHFYKCSVCGQSKGVSHEYTSTVTKVSTASTCTKTFKKCSCGYSTTVTDTSHRFTGIRCLDCNYWRG